MCLTRLDKVYKRKRVKERICFKVFDKFCGDLCFKYQGDKRKKIPVHEWIHEKDYRSVLYMNYKFLEATFDVNKHRIFPVYPFGFHVYENLIDAKEQCSCGFYLYKVAVRKVVAKGIQNGLNVLVAEEMKIIKEIK